MKLLARAVIASAATIGLVAGLGGTAHAATQLGDYVQSCSDGEGHKGYMSYTTWKNVDKDRPNMTFMKAVTNKEPAEESSVSRPIAVRPPLTDLRSRGWGSRRTLIAPRTTPTARRNPSR